MWRLLLAAVLFWVSMPLDAQGSKWAIVPLHGGPDRVGLLPEVEGYSTLEEAIAEVPEDQTITEIRIHPKFLYGDEMQREILGYFEEHYPEELKQALASSGNLHNPALQPLFTPLKEAILATSYVERLGKLLAPSRHRIAGATFEKVALSTRTDSPGISAIVWVLVEKIPEPDAEGGSPHASERDPERG